MDRTDIAKELVEVAKMLVGYNAERIAKSLVSRWADHSSPFFVSVGGKVVEEFGEYDTRRGIDAALFEARKLLASNRSGTIEILDAEQIAFARIEVAFV